MLTRSWIIVLFLTCASRVIIDPFWFDKNFSVGLMLSSKLLLGVYRFMPGFVILTLFQSDRCVRNKLQFLPVKSSLNIDGFFVTVKKVMHIMLCVIGDFSEISGMFLLVSQLNMSDLSVTFFLLKSDRYRTIYCIVISVSDLCFSSLTSQSSSCFQSCVPIIALKTLSWLEFKTGKDKEKQTPTVPIHNYQFQLSKAWYWSSSQRAEQILCEQSLRKCQQ